MCMCDCVVCRNSLNAILIEEHNDVSPFGARCGIALHQSSKLIPKALVQISHVARSLANVLCFVAVLPVYGWTTLGLANCSRSGMIVPVGCFVKNEIDAYMLVSLR